MRTIAVGSACAALIVLGAVPAAASPVPQQVQFDTYCTPDAGLEELSGLAEIDGIRYAIGDSGTDHRLAVLDAPSPLEGSSSAQDVNEGAPGAQCRIARWLDVPVDPYDVEDLASYGGNLWLSDTGDNLARRDTVALTRMDPSTGAGELHRLTYPDGPHDAEALIIEPGGRPVIITKEYAGIAGVYVPEANTAVDDLASPGPTPLRKVGEVPLERTSTQGGPAFIGGSSAVTGGAMSVDGSVAALRTYTDAYLFPIDNGDVATALTNPDTSVALVLPNQPQGEALVFDDSGDLYIASESAGGPIPPLQVARGVVDLVHAQMPTAAAPDTHTSGVVRAGVAAGIVIAVLLAGFGVARIRRRR